MNSETNDEGGKVVLSDDILDRVLDKMTGSETPMSEPTLYQEAEWSEDMAARGVQFLYDEEMDIVLAPVELDYEMLMTAAYALVNDVDGLAKYKAFVNKSLGIGDTDD